MADISLKRISKLPLSYRKSLDHKTGWEKNANEHVACEETASWRTFSTSSAPSELLSFHRDAHMYTVGRAIASLGRYIANPIDNAMAKREFRKVLAYLKELKTAEDWVEAKQLLETKDVLSGFLEAARPMYPPDVRNLAHIILSYAIVCCGIHLSHLQPKLEFATRKEYESWIEEQSKVIASICPSIRFYLFILPTPEDAILQDLTDKLDSLTRPERPIEKRSSVPVELLDLRSAAVRCILRRTSFEIPWQREWELVRWIAFLEPCSLSDIPFSLRRPLFRYCLEKLRAAQDAEDPLMAMDANAMRALGALSPFNMEEVFALQGELGSLHFFDDPWSMPLHPGPWPPHWVLQCLQPWEFHNWENVVGPRAYSQVPRKFLPPYVNVDSLDDIPAKKDVLHAESSLASILQVADFHGYPQIRAAVMCSSRQERLPQWPVQFVNAIFDRYLGHKCGGTKLSKSAIDTLLRTLIDVYPALPISGQKIFRERVLVRMQGMAPGPTTCRDTDLDRSLGELLDVLFCDDRGAKTQIVGLALSQTGDANETVTKYWKWKELFELDIWWDIVYEKRKGYWMTVAGGPSALQTVEPFALPPRFEGPARVIVVKRGIP